MTDTMREKFERFRDEYYNVHCMDAGQAISFEVGYQAAQADARALVGELVEALASVKCDMYDTKPLDDDICEEVERALTKAQAFMEANND